MMITTNLSGETGDAQWIFQSCWSLMGPNGVAG